MTIRTSTSDAKPPPKRRIGRASTLLALVLSVLFGSVAFAPAPAHAVDDLQETMLRSWPTGLCLETMEVRGVDTAPVFMRPCNFGYSQRWRYDYFPPALNAGSGTWAIKNMRTGWCLDGNDAGAVYAKPCQWTNTWQKWNVYPFRDNKGHDVVRIQGQRTRRYLNAEHIGTDREDNTSKDWHEGY